MGQGRPACPASMAACKRSRTAARSTPPQSLLACCPLACWLHPGAAPDDLNLCLDHQTVAHGEAVHDLQERTFLRRAQNSDAEFPACHRAAAHTAATQQAFAKQQRVTTAASESASAAPKLPKVAATTGNGAFTLPNRTFDSSMNFFHPQSCSFLQKRCSVSLYLDFRGSWFTTAIVNCTGAESNRRAGNELISSRGGCYLDLRGSWFTTAIVNCGATKKEQEIAAINI